MVEIVKFNMDNQEQFRNILKFVRDNYGYGKAVIVYCVYINGRFGFVKNNGGFFKLVLNNSNGLQIYDFVLNSDYEVKSVHKDGYEVDYLDDGNISYTSSNGNISYLYYDNNELPNYDEYDGKVFFEQYNPSRDLKCDIAFPYMKHIYDKNGIMPIYERQLGDFKEVYIDEKFSQNGGDPVGYVNRNHHYFNRFTTNKGKIDHEIVLLKSKGLIDYIKSSFIQGDEGSLDRFCTAKYITKSRLMFSFFPYTSIYTEEQLCDYIKSLGFEINIPEFILNAYNGYDSIISGIHEIAKEIKKVELINNEQLKLVLSVQE